jgi:hypothetical protein
MNAGNGVWHVDGPAAQIRAMANWVEGEAFLHPLNRETLRKVATNLRAAIDALEASGCPPGGVR